MNKYLLGAAALASFASAASANITVDGQIDAAYGPASATVATDPNAPDSNFGAPENRAIAGYDIYLSSDASKVYGLVDLTGGNSAGNFANLYFDLNPTVGDGSDLGFEIGQNSVNAFIPGKNGQPGFNKVLDASNYAIALVPGGGLEFSLAKSLFTSPIAGLAYYDGQTFEGTITLRLSQSLSYSVAGGPSYGPNRLGAINVGGVPEPASWAMMIAGFALAGAAARRRSRPAVFA